MVIRSLLFLLCACLAWSCQAQQLMPEKESQRRYMPFSEAAPKIFAAAVARSIPKTDDESLSVQDSYNRILEFAKYAALEINANQADNEFSYMSFLPQLVRGGKIYGESFIYTFGYGTLSAVAGRPSDAFIYRMRPVYQSSSSGWALNPVVRIYDPDLTFTFKNFPRLENGALKWDSLCSGPDSPCSVLPDYEWGRYKWFYRKSNWDSMIACTDVSDCVQAAVSYDFYQKTFALRQTGGDPYSVYYGSYLIRPTGNCADSSNFGYLHFVSSGLLCFYSLQYNVTKPKDASYFYVDGTAETSSLAYIRLEPFPVVCPGANKFFQFAACDSRFENDVLSLSSLADLVDRLYFQGSTRLGYKGIFYEPVVSADVRSAIGNTLVKVSSLGELLPVPKPEKPNPTLTPKPGLNLGSDPGVSAPSIDSVEASSILGGIFDLFPSLRAFSTGTYSAVCPVLEPSIFGSTLHIDAHCRLLENQRVLLGAVFLIAWAFLSFRIVLRA